MGGQLYAQFPVFAETIDEICAEFDQHLVHCLKNVMFASPGSPQASLLNQSAFTQPALFAIEVALYRLVQSWGIQPDYLIGHSLGELVAAYVAGVFTLPDACVVVAARGRLMGELATGGAMIAVTVTEQEVAVSLQGYGHRLSIAGINSPTSTVV